MAGKFLSLEDAARQLGVSVDEVNRLVDRKKLFPMRDGATIKFKADDVERVGRSLGEESSMSGDLSLDLEMPDVAPALSAAGSLSGLDTDDIVVGDAIEAGESIFSVDASDLNAASQTLVRGDEALGGSAIAVGPASGLSMPSLGGASAADVVLGDSLVGEGPESEDLALESVVGGSSQLLSSSPSLDSGSAASTPKSLVAPALSDASGTLAIDLSDIAGGPAGGAICAERSGNKAKNGKRAARKRSLMKMRIWWAFWMGRTCSYWGKPKIRSSRNPPRRRAAWPRGRRRLYRTYVARAERMGCCLRGLGLGAAGDCHPQRRHRRREGRTPF